MLYKSIAKPVLFRMDPEKAHHLTIDGLHTFGKIPGGRRLLQAVWGVGVYPELETELWNIKFTNRWALPQAWTRTARRFRAFPASASASWRSGQ